MFYLRSHQQASNASYQKELGVSKRTASREITDLVKKGLIRPVGSSSMSIGRGALYEICIPASVKDRK